MRTTVARVSAAVAVLGIVDPVHHATTTEWWEEHEFEYETIDTKKVVQVIQSNDEIERLNKQVSHR